MIYQYYFIQNFIFKNKEKMKNFTTFPTDKIIDDTINNLKDVNIQNVNNES